MPYRHNDRLELIESIIIFPSVLITPSKPSVKMKYHWKNNEFKCFNWIWSLFCKGKSDSFSDADTVSSNWTAGEKNCRRVRSVCVQTVNAADSGNEPNGNAKAQNYASTESGENNNYANEGSRPELNKPEDVRDVVVENTTIVENYQMVTDDIETIIEPTVNALACLSIKRDASISSDSDTTRKEGESEIDVSKRLVICT